MNIWEITYLNCGERYEFVIDHHSCTHNLRSCEIKAWKKVWPERARAQDLGDDGVVQIYDLSYIHLHLPASSGILRAHKVTGSQMAW